MKAILSTEKLQFFESALRRFFRYASRAHLPWRRRGIGIYEVWVSEIMLQQTQVSRVIGYYERFLKRFPTVESLARTSWEDFLPYYQGLGYYARGRNMLRAAQMIVSEYGGRFPKDVGGLEKLPGVGPYTAAAIASFAYGRNTIAWDTNLRRVIGRFFFGTRHLFSVIPASEPESRSRITRPNRSAKRSAQESGMTIRKLEQTFSLPARTLNAALMDFGSAICTARPKCANCPLSKNCVYFKEDGKQEQSYRYAKRSDRPSRTWKDARVFVILHENHRKYYSSLKTKYAPFLVPPSHNTRAGIKDWFRDRYGLELSVRPPHRKAVIDGKPTLSVNAQILIGNPGFRAFGKASAIDNSEQL